MNASQHDPNAIIPEHQPIPYKVYRQLMLEMDHAKSTPALQFGNHVEHEVDLLRQQRTECVSGHCQILPFDPEDDDRTNAERNVRADWIEQGIWKDSWTTDDISGGWKEMDDYIDQHGRCVTVNSRPHIQFQNQVMKERRWLLAGTREMSSDLLDTEAYGNVKSRWQNWGIWRSTWQSIPEARDLWQHENGCSQMPAHWSASDAQISRSMTQKMPDGCTPSPGIAAALRTMTDRYRKVVKKRKRAELLGTANLVGAQIEQCSDPERNARRASRTRNRASRKRVKFVNGAVGTVSSAIPGRGTLNANFDCSAVLRSEDDQ